MFFSNENEADLLMAVLQNDEKKVNSLIASGVNINAREPRAENRSILDFMGTVLLLR